jgi:WhiB family redox-sensing transcriptional regulator
MSRPTLPAASTPSPDLTGAACTGRSDLFDPKAGPQRHRTALALCARCPVLAACRAWFASLPAAQVPKGVVAGTVKGTRHQLINDALAQSRAGRSHPAHTRAGQPNAHAGIPAAAVPKIRPRNSN